MVEMKTIRKIIEKEINFYEKEMSQKAKVHHERFEFGIKSLNQVLNEIMKSPHNQKIEEVKVAERSFVEAVQQIEEWVDAVRENENDEDTFDSLTSACLTVTKLQQKIIELIPNPNKASKQSRLEAK